MTCTPSASGPVRRWPSVLGVVAVAVVAASLVGCSNTSGGGDASGGDAPRQLSGVVVDPVPVVSTLSLPRADAAAEPFGFTADEGGVLLVYFGYTACPDVCPTTLADLKAALRQLGSDSERVSIAMATIDPRRDTAEVISGYLRSFFPTATALRTDDDAALRAVTNAFGASYLTEYPTTGEPRVSHSAFLYVVDDQGHVVLAWPFGTTSSDIALDLEQLLT